MVPKLFHVPRRQTVRRPHESHVRDRAFPLLVLLAQPLGYISFWIPVLLIGIGASAHQARSCNIFTTVSDMFPQKSIASVVGIGGMAGGLGGVVMTKIGGWVLITTKPSTISTPAT